VSPAANVPALASLVAAGVLDSGLAGLAWLLLEDGIPVHVAGREPDAAEALLDALISALPPERRPGPAASGGAHRLVRVAGPLSTASPPGVLRAALAATTGRSGLAAAIMADDLPGVLAVFRRQRLSDEEISFMGVVLVLGSARDGAGCAGRGPGRVVAAHYLRPVARDAGGHLQRLGPAVLATLDPERSRYDHFAWGIYPELAARTGRRAGDLEHEHVLRAESLLPGAERGHD
jgi:hypothetical protein